jgi:hypothetical protein
MAFIPKLAQIETAVSPFGQVIGFSEGSIIGSIVAIQFNEPISIGSDNGEHPWYLNAYAGGIGEFGFFTKNQMRPLAVELRGTAKNYFVSSDSRTFVFSFSLFFGNKNLEKDFYAKSKLEQEEDFIRGATIFFERLTKYGLSLFQKEFYGTCSDMSIDSINHELIRMADWWFGQCVKKIDNGTI